MAEIHEYYRLKRRKRLENTASVFPDYLKALKAWVCYKVYRSPEDGKKKKVLLSALTGKWASITDKNGWTDFETAKKYAIENNCEGVSFALRDSGYTCIDLDGCYDNNDNLSILADKILTLSNNTFVEKSVSGKGLHIFLKGNFLEGYKVRAEGGLEVFDNKFISVTGDIISSGTEIKEPSEELKKFLKNTLGKQAEIYQNLYISNTKRTSDEAILKRIERSKVASEFNSLFNGTIAFDGDHSRSDFRLIGILVYFTNGDGEQVKRLFKRSGLYRPEKGENYIDITLRKAIQTTRFSTQRKQ